MWHEIFNQDDFVLFNKLSNYFHDSCIKELRYVSGAYVDRDYSMYPLNDKNTVPKRIFAHV